MGASREAEGGGAPLSWLRLTPRMHRRRGCTDARAGSVTISTWQALTDPDRATSLIPSLSASLSDPSA